MTHKEIGLLRHGKSDWDSGAETDHQRPLVERGVDASRLMGRFLQRSGLTPQEVWTSSALRARETAELAARAGRWDCPIEVTGALYATEAEAVLDLLRRLDRDLDRILLVGHNPTWEELLALLIGGGRFKLPTGGLAWIHLPSDRWADCRPGTGVLRWLVTPKLLHTPIWRDGGLPQSGTSQQPL